ncbi:hypothetical protein, partial [Enterococcus camelliae]
ISSIKIKKSQINLIHAIILINKTVILILRLEKISLKKYLITFLVSVISALFFRFLKFEGLIHFIGIASLVLGLVLSGTMVSGDRMRANSQGEQGYSKTYYIYPIIFSIPYLFLFIF